MNATLKWNDGKLACDCVAVATVPNEIFMLFGQPFEDDHYTVHLVTFCRHCCSSGTTIMETMTIRAHARNATIVE